MRRTALALILLLGLLFSAKVGETLAQTHQVGVTQGDSFSYEVGVSGYIPDFQYFNVEKIGKISVNVTSVSGTLINFTAYVSYRNGTKTSEDSIMDVKTGGITNSSLPRFFVSANLRANDNVIPYRDYPKINKTITTAYSKGGTRETNYFRVNALDSNTTFYSYIDFYYDRQTGALVELYCYGENTNVPYSTSYWLKLEKTNLWTVSESPYPSQPPSYFLGLGPPDYGYLIVAVVAVVAVAGVGLLVYFRKRKR
jgi:hypothetical protein